MCRLVFCPELLAPLSSGTLVRLEKVGWVEWSDGGGPRQRV